MRAVLRNLVPVTCAMALTVAFAASADPTPERPVRYNMTDVEMGIQRTSCYGTCPSYSIVIRGDGSGVYEGRDFVAIRGRHAFDLKRGDVVHLLNEFVGVDFFSFQSRYTERPLAYVDEKGNVAHTTMSVSDVPNTILTFRVGTYSKSVEFNFLAPKDLIALADSIDQRVGTRRWVSLQGFDAPVDSSR